MEYAIEVRDLRKRYGNTLAVDGVSFSVSPGEVFGLLGPNGAGKTTTVECLLGLRQPESGEVRLLGMDHRHASQAILARTGVQLQTTGLLPQLTALEQVHLFAGLFPSALPAEEVLAATGLADRARTPTRALSGGQKQRLAVALALVNDPDLVFLDEPTTGLDPQARRNLWEVIRDLKSRGKTVLLTTHYMEEAEQLCERVGIMDNGRIIELDSPQALIHRHFQETAIELVALGEAPLESLREIPGVVAVAGNGRPGADGVEHDLAQSRAEGGLPLTLYSADVPRTMSGLYALAAQGCLAFQDLKVRQASLEDVFLKLTGRRIRQ